MNPHQDATQNHESGKALPTTGMKLYIVTYARANGKDEHSDYYILTGSPAEILVKSRELWRKLAIQWLGKQAQPGTFVTAWRGLSWNDLTDNDLRTVVYHYQLDETFGFGELIMEVL